MNKTELIDAIAEKADVSKKDTDAVLTATINAIMEAVASGDKISLIGFGSFEPRERKARDGRNPQTGETIKIPATTVPAFSAGKGFKQMVSGAKD
ncbi:MAG: DNA-binding protein HU-beta [Phormidesmis priestleyi Ana]|uniref:DNA-binding protein HU-beta n=1 Tax=Phormidesmis priestleyi Ana TaxID=1666911 RepID=A0A0P7ZD62_9CYAN|nr:MAG: DNA-binding protein HU-beta [Phormidesmis priestleyi Ana]